MLYLGLLPASVAVILVVIAHYYVPAMATILQIGGGLCVGYYISDKINNWVNYRRFKKRKND